jgi:hypothetical protein
VFLKFEKRKIKMSAPSFFKNTPNKIGEGIDVSGKNTLIKTDNVCRVAIADDPIDAKVDGKKMFCIRVDNEGVFAPKKFCVRVGNSGSKSSMLIGFTPMETFDSTEEALFGWNGFTGAGINSYLGDLFCASTAQ